MEPTLAAARARVAAVRPCDYARTRNHLEGAVTGLSPYITHGFLSLQEVMEGVAARHALDARHKFVFELGWRAYFRHVWQHRGEGILQSLHPGVLPDAAYARELPADIRDGATGVPVIDQAVHTLYTTGMLHNHARMWLASYVVHLRKVHWRAGADWLYAHLLDGDLASHHLSWQWVAGTASHKPYLFNAENVARYAPEPWHSPGTVIDTSYEVLDRLARQAVPLPAGPATSRQRRLSSVNESQRQGEPRRHAEPPASLAATPPSAEQVQGREVWLVHPWSLGDVAAAAPEGTLLLGLYLSDFHRAWPWNERRWRFVGERMAQITAHCWHGDAASVRAALAGAARVRWQEDPHLTPWLSGWAEAVPVPALFPAVTPRCDSFSRWWSRVAPA